MPPLPGFLLMVVSDKAKAVGRKALIRLDTTITPDTLMRWRRRLTAQKWVYRRRRGPGRPGIMREIPCSMIIDRDGKYMEP